MTGFDEVAADESASSAEQVDDAGTGKVGVSQIIEPSGSVTVPGPVAHRGVHDALKSL